MSHSAFSFSTVVSEGRLAAILRRRDPKARVHCKIIWDLKGAVRYASKSLLRHPELEKYVILMPQSAAEGCNPSRQRWVKTGLTTVDSCSAIEEAQYQHNFLGDLGEK